MRMALRTGAVIALAIGGLIGFGTREARAQIGVPYGPYSMPRAQFNRFAPVYYPRINTNLGFGFGSYGRPRFYSGGYRGNTYGFSRRNYGFNRGFRRR